MEHRVAFLKKRAFGDAVVCTAGPENETQIICRNMPRSFNKISEFWIAAGTPKLLVMAQHSTTLVQYRPPDCSTPFLVSKGEIAKKYFLVTRPGWPFARRSQWRRGYSRRPQAYLSSVLASSVDLGPCFSDTKNFGLPFPRLICASETSPIPFLSLFSI